MWDLIVESKPIAKAVQDVRCDWIPWGALASPSCTVGRAVRAKFLLNLAEEFVYCPYCGKRSKVVEKA